MTFFEKYYIINFVKDRIQILIFNSKLNGDKSLDNVLNKQISRLFITSKRRLTEVSKSLEEQSKEKLIEEIIRLHNYIIALQNQNRQLQEELNNVR